ncbi:MAG: WDGH domain-containing protein [Desulfuromonadaceae bacterium]
MSQQQHNDAPRFFPNPFASEFCEFFRCRTQRCKAKYIIGQPSDSSLVQPGFLRVCEQDAISIVSQLPPELLQYIPELKDMEAAKDGAYLERNMCVALIARMALTMGLTVGIGKHPEGDATWERDWMNIVFIDLPAGQCSWHIHDSEIPMFSFLPEYAGQWDGHDTAEKYRRVLKPINSDDFWQTFVRADKNILTEKWAKGQSLKETMLHVNGIFDDAKREFEKLITEKYQEATKGSHLCPYCNEPFASASAMGGHKKSCSKKPK